MIPEIINNPLDNLKITLPPDTTTATLTQYYSKINQTWEVGTQLVDTEGIIVSRDFAVLSFPPTETKLIKVGLPEYDPDWESDFYYLLITYFTETFYSSNYQSTIDLPFNEWLKEVNVLKHEKYYKHKQIGQLVYNRPIISLPEVSPPVESSLIQYAPIEENFTLTFNVGNALGAIITSISDIEVRLKDTLEEAGTLVNPAFILLTKPYISITFKNITPTSHLNITITFYGQYHYSVPVPKSSMPTAEEFTLIHPYNTSYEDRLKPPGLPNLPDNFWNTNYGNIPNTDFTNRNSAPAWI